MDRRKFLNRMSAATAASIAGATTLSGKADALEDAMAADLDKRRSKSRLLCNVDGELEQDPDDRRPYFQHYDPILPKMPDAPTLVDFFNLRFSSQHVLQSARLAVQNKSSEKVVMACLLHDIGLNLVGTDHGYWCAQLIKPYVDPEITWAIEKHQALRFFPDDDYGYEYPKAYIDLFGSDYEPEPYIHQAYEEAKGHKWYDTSRQITINDLYSFNRDITVEVDDFTDIIGRHFNQPKKGLGFDGSPVAHMWRTFIWPNNFL